jgi:DNA repair exonuclease SbcCD ATPase subunit
MGRAKRESPEIAQDDRIRFVDLPTRRRVAIEIDLSKPAGAGVTASRAIAGANRAGGVEGAVVRITVRHPKGSELEAQRAAQLTAADARAAGAAFVRRPEYVSDASQQEAVTVSGEASSMRPSDLFKKYMASARGIPPKVAEAVTEIVLAELASAGNTARPPAAVKLARIARLKVRGLMAFGSRQSDLSFADGVYGVSGVHAGEPGSSNRAGKSDLLDSIEIAFFGSCSRKLKGNKGLVNDFCQEASVEMLFETDEGLHEVKRTFRGTKQTAALESGHVHVTGLDEVNARIAGLIGTGQEDFVRTFFVRQGDLAGMLTEQNAAARGHIARWAGLDVWDAVSSALSKKAAAAEASAKSVRGALESAEASLAGAEGRAVDQAAIDRMRGDLDRMKGAADLDRRRSAAKEAIVEREEALAELKAYDQKAARESLSAAERVARDAAEDAAAARDAVVKAKSKVGDGPRGAFSGQCPVDGCDCPRKAEINSDSKWRREAGATLEADEGSLARANRKAASTSANVDELRKGTVRWDSELKRKPAIEAELAKLKAELKDAGPPADGPVDIPTAEQGLEEAIRANERLAMARSDAARLRREAGEAADKAFALRSAATASGREGVVGMALRDSLARIESVANGVLESMGAPVRLAWEEDAQGKLNPVSVDASGRRPMALDSGGGCDLLAIGTRVALSRMLGCPLLFLDEVDGRMDPVNLAALGDMLRRVGEAGVRQVLVVSHRPEIADSMGHKIVVTRDRAAGQSVAEMVVG